MKAQEPARAENIVTRHHDGMLPRHDPLPLDHWDPTALSDMPRPLPIDSPDSERSGDRAAWKRSKCASLASDSCYKVRPQRDRVQTSLVEFLELEGILFASHQSFPKILFRFSTMDLHANMSRWHESMKKKKCICYYNKKGRTQCRRLPALCGVWGRVVFKIFKFFPLIFI